jgi:hypothetical protein
MKKTYKIFAVVILTNFLFYSLVSFGGDGKKNKNSTDTKEAKKISVDWKAIYRSLLDKHCTTVVPGIYVENQTTGGHGCQDANQTCQITISPCPMIANITGGMISQAKYYPGNGVEINKSVTIISSRNQGRDPSFTQNSLTYQAGVFTLKILDEATGDVYEITYRENN